MVKVESSKRLLCALNRNSLLGDINSIHGTEEGASWRPGMAEQEGRTSMLQDILEKFKTEGRVRNMYK